MSDRTQARRLFLGCFIGLVATAFGFAVRGAVLKDWEIQFDLTEEQKGIIGGVGLFPFAISIILLSLVVDRIGYGTTMALAFAGHLASALLTIFAPNFQVLYVATFLYALANGAVEAVINPVVATIHRENKTHWLNILHAGWPGGMVLGGLLSILVVTVLGANPGLAEQLPGKPWQWQMSVLLLPIFAYGMLLLGQKFPQQERVEAGVSFRTMLEEFGWASAYIVSFLIIMGISQMLKVFEFDPILPARALGYALIPAALFAFFIRSFGRPVFVFLMLVMFLLATTELGTDGWIQDIIGSVRESPTTGTWFLVYTSAIMFVLRFFAGPIVHRISPLGLLALSAAVASVGLTWLGNAGTTLAMLLAAATLYAFGKTFFWPTTLGVVSEQYPRGGALLLNAISGVGMISIGTIGGPAIGTLQDQTLAAAVARELPEQFESLKKTVDGQFFPYEAVDAARIAALPADLRDQVQRLQRATKQQALAKIAVLPAIMCVCYLGLIAYYRSRGGYQAEVLTGHAAEDEKFTGGTIGPGEG
ncbi:MAG TPA: MFS transporter [Lacipirellulaceae bacterium]|nr:MFS transporter [Lacipirellulaceae bacterium]